MYTFPIMENIEQNQLQEVANNFEAASHQNGICYWLDTELMRLLGYTDYAAFRSIVNKAISSCAGLDIDPLDDFIRYEHIAADGTCGYYKFTRLACFLITQQADQSKHQVRLLQYCLARMADTIMQQADLERLETRTRLSSEEKALSSTAKNHGLINYAYFKDQGYRGMYNMSLATLKKRKGFNSINGTLYDRMNNTELAANLFRITQTNERIKSKNISGQQNLETAAYDVGRSVRRIMIENTGKKPEAIPLATAEIKEIKKEGKKAVKNIRQIDAPKRSRNKKKSE